MSIAFLDFDGTLLTRDSGRICALPSLRRGLVGPRAGTRLVATYVAHLLGLASRTAVQHAGFNCYAGRTLAELRALMEELHDGHMRASVSSVMRARVAEHQRAGDRTVIITASAFFFAEPLARELGIDELVGTRVGFASERCTGRADGPIVEGVRKVEHATRIAAAHGASLADCSFYSDHIADLPLLEIVGRPVAVGPEPGLARVAHERGWPVLTHDAAT